MANRIRQNIERLLSTEQFLEEVDRIVDFDEEVFGIGLEIEQQRLGNAHSRTVHAAKNYLLRLAAGKFPIDSLLYVTIGRLCFEITGHYAARRATLSELPDGDAAQHLSEFRALYEGHPRVMFASQCALDIAEDIIAKAIQRPVPSTFRSDNVAQLRRIVELIEADEMQAYRILDLAGLNWAFQRLR